MGQEFFIKSDNLESQVRKLLPSQGGLGQNFDLSASTQIIPIVDLTESAEGSNFREDLQKSFSLDSITVFSANNANVDIVTNVGYFRIYGISNITSASGNSEANFSITDGVTTKKIVQHFVQGSSTTTFSQQLFDFIVKVEAGHSIKCQSTASDVFVTGNTRQIATIDGELVNP